MKGTIGNLKNNESGQTALVLVLILVVLGALILGPLLAYMGTGLKAGQMHEDKTQRYYAADAGIEDAMWQIKSDQLSGLFPGYDPYDYGITYPYTLSDDVNGKDVDITIGNVWMPKDLSAPSPSEARAIIESGKLIITGSITAPAEYQIKLAYYYGDDDPNGENLNVETIGIWLPPGFNYEGNCSLADDPDTQPYSTPDVEVYCGGRAVLWDFASVPLKNFPGSAGFPMQTSFTFEFSPADESPASALSWIDTSGVTAVDYTWDADVKVYAISSVATDPGTGKQTTVETYSSKIEMRKLGSAISGDYHAIGATLMTTTSDPYYRDRLFNESSATIAAGDIPSSAIIEAAFLFWSGWIEGSGRTVFYDDCSDYSDWANPGSDWGISSGRFRGHHLGGENHRYLAMSDSIDLSGLEPGSTNVRWTQSEEGSLEYNDCLKFQFSADGGSNWGPLITAFCNDLGWYGGSFVYEVPQEYLTSGFKMRFYLDGFNDSDWGGTEAVYIDNITISVSPTNPVIEKVNRVMFNGNQITTNQWQVAPTPDSGAPESWCYSCFYDVTAIVRADLDPHTKSGTFTLGHVLEGGSYTLYPSGTTDYPLATPASCTGWGCGEYQWTYAGWSLIIIYSSPQTQGHQIYLFDDLRYVAVHTTLPFSMTGFLVPEPIAGEEYAAHITAFVGDGDEQYSGDFIALNPPSVPSSQIPNSYKLWDGITLPSIPTARSRLPMPNNASSPNNVWNSQSAGLAAGGIDVDNFQVTWSSGLLQPGDTSAEVVLGNAGTYPEDAELIMVVYVIIAFRSEATTGGTLGYLVR